jgi:hypothetical protein
MDRGGRIRSGRAALTRRLAESRHERAGRRPGAFAPLAPQG